MNLYRIVGSFNNFKNERFVVAESIAAAISTLQALGFHDLSEVRLQETSVIVARTPTVNELRYSEGQPK